VADKGAMAATAENIPEYFKISRRDQCVLRGVLIKPYLCLSCPELSTEAFCASSFAS
jgi:hypothetical protein